MFEFCISQPYLGGWIHDIKGSLSYLSACGRWFRRALCVETKGFTSAASMPTQGGAMNAPIAVALSLTVILTLSGRASAQLNQATDDITPISS